MFAAYTLIFFDSSLMFFSFSLSLTLSVNGPYWPVVHIWLLVSKQVEASGISIWMRVFAHAVSQFTNSSSGDIKLQINLKLYITSGMWSLFRKSNKSDDQFK